MVLEMEDFFKEIFYIFPGKTLNINCGYSDPKGYNENKLESTLYEDACLLI